MPVRNRDNISRWSYRGNGIFRPGREKVEHRKSGTGASAKGSKTSLCLHIHGHFLIHYSSSYPTHFPNEPLSMVSCFFFTDNDGCLTQELSLGSAPASPNL